jgi:transcriptional regulator NrdR family protein
MAGIECPNCGATESRVKRSGKESRHVRRTRVCKLCGTEWLTLESTRGVTCISQLSNDGSYRAAGTIPAADTLARFEQEKKHD